VVFFDPALAEGFERRRKRAGQLWSKLRYLSAQLDAYLEDDLWRANAAQANRMAARLAAGLASIRGVEIVQQVQANEVFAAMPDRLIEAMLAEGAYFYRWIGLPGDARPVVRLVAAFNTTVEEVDAFVALAKRLGA
jgi:threonine aldolase